jgi:tetratricopeptide (TPR) repeat protein
MLTLIFVVGILAQTGADQQWLAKLATADRLLREVRTADAPAAQDRAPRIADRDGVEELASALVAYENGNRYCQGGRFLEAGKSYKHALEVFVSKLGPAHHISVDAAIQLSSTYLETGQVSKAAAVLRSHLIAEDRLSVKDRATLLGDLGSVLMCQQRLAEAERTYREALDVFEADTDVQSRERTLIALSNLSGVYLKTRRIPQAVAAMERARSVLATLPNAAPQMTVKTLANTAVVYASMKTQPEKADELFQAAIQFCQQALGRDHFLLGPILENYADFLRGERRKDEAKAAQKRGKAIQATFARENLLNHTVDVGAPRFAVGRPAPD